MITSQYFGSNSITRACRPIFSQAMIVVPLPPNGSGIVSRDLLLFRSARSTSSGDLKAHTLALWMCYPRLGRKHRRSSRQSSQRSFNRNVCWERARVATRRS
jgi:hypothetical protein